MLKARGVKHSKHELRVSFCIILFHVLSSCVRMSSQDFNGSQRKRIITALKHESSRMGRSTMLVML